MKPFLIYLLLLSTLPLQWANSAVLLADENPNFIVVFADDQGYGDLGCFGSETIKTPNIDRLASEGRKYTSFYVPCSVCSPSRAALLTGCYPKRVGMHKGVLFPRSDHGLHPQEHTIADHLKANGYATACFGKWHLGHLPEMLPTAQGFDTYFGIPYSNDMNHPDNTGRPQLKLDKLWADQESCLTKWNTPLMEDEAVTEVPVDQRTITRRYTDKAIDFIKSNKEKPFFVYLPHSMPHIPLYVPEDRYDANPDNAYKCVIEHIDAEVGRLAQSVRDLGLAENTWIIYTSDNGPWLRFKNHAGSAGPLRSGKGTTFEGGQRVPCVVWAPGRVEAGTSSDAFATTMDLLPTIAAITQTELPKTPIDGVDISATFTGDASPREEMLFYAKNGELEGIRVGDWKYLDLPASPRNAKKRQELLFNLADDLSENENLIESNREMADKLKSRMLQIDEEVSAGARAAWKALK